MAAHPRPAPAPARLARVAAVVVCCAAPAGFAQAPPRNTPAPPAGPPREQDIAPDPLQPPKPDPAAASTSSPPPASAPHAPEHVHTMDEVTVPQSLLRFSINFFGDVSAGATYPDRPRTSFGIGTVGVRMGGQLGASLDALAELAFETTDGPIVDVEQLAMRWRRGPGELVVGRLHTELGYWNTAYHHGRWLQLSIERPRALRFEDDGGIFSTHWVGAQYTLRRGAFGGDGALVLAIGNGRGDTLDDILVTSDTNNAKAGLVKLRWRRSGAEVGLGFIYDPIAPAAAAIRPALPDEQIHELTASAYATMRGGDLVVIAEGYAFHHRASEQGWTTLTGYGLVGLDVRPALTPYIAVDVIRGADDDPYFTPDPAMAPAFDALELLGGIRLETSTWSALKLELRFTHQPRDPEGDDDYTAVVNWSFGL